MKSGATLISEMVRQPFMDEPTDPSWLPLEVRTLQEQGADIAKKIDAIRDEQKKSIIPGTKLIITAYGGVLSAKKGNVFTFANWYIDKYFPEDEWRKYQYVQVQELLDQGNTEHNLSFWEMEIFDPAIHKEFRMMNSETLKKDHNEFVEKYGA